jgi:hypothetical protein
MPILQIIEYMFYLGIMTSLAPEASLHHTGAGPATPPAHSWRLTAGEEAAAVAELQHTAAGWAALLGRVRRFWPSAMANTRPMPLICPRRLVPGLPLSSLTR